MTHKSCFFTGYDYFWTTYVLYQPLKSYKQTVPGHIQTALGLIPTAFPVKLHEVWIEK